MKPGTFTQLYTQLVFANKYRENLFNSTQRSLIFSYISGIITHLNHKSIIVNGYSDHVHILFGQNPSISISDTVGRIKKASSGYINENNWFKGQFSWQDGYGAFSYSRSQIDKVYAYIQNQENHHRKNNFKEEYMNMLQKVQIDFDEKYLFEFFENNESDL